MADTVKISALPIATTVSGGNVLPVVQGGITKQVNVNNIFDAVSSLTTATTVSGGEYMPIVQGGVSKKLDVLDIFDTVSIPGNDSLEGAWLCDEYITISGNSPIVDNSGNNLHLTAHGVTPDGSGNLIFNGVNDYLATTDNLAIVPDEMFFLIDFPSGHVQPSSTQYLVNYRLNGVGRFGAARVASSDTLSVGYYSGSSDLTVSFNAFFTGYSSSLLLCGIYFNWTTGLMRAYRNGVQFGTDQYMTTPVKPLAGAKLYFGSYQGTSYYLAGTMGKILYYSRDLTNPEIRGLYLGLLPQLPYGLINWQNSYMTSSAITTSSFSINTTSGYIIPTGKYEFSATSPLVQLQFLSGSTWYGASYLSGQVCADGVNVRAYNPTASGVTVYYRKLDL